MVVLVVALFDFLSKVKRAESQNEVGMTDGNEKRLELTDFFYLLRFRYNTKPATCSKALFHLLHYI